ncbi:hypothetical protein LTR08_004915 [Meristemomyces frigidus]|nr:hypothetical protein LTR08_004915 [Meristemomyces frigidus]
MKKHLTIVIKLGTSSIVDEKTHEPLLSILSTIVETAVGLHHDGHRVVICSSGAIGMALRQMDMERRPKHLPQVQALAAIGQCKLMSMWDQLFMHMRQPVAQILLTRNDIADRTQYLNAQNTFVELLNMGVIPIVNENDTLSVQEIKFGDNDTLSAITAGMVQADYLFLMTDVDCLYDKNPRTNPDAKAIEVVEDIAELEADVSGAGSSLGTGGMGTKIVAARLATAAGVTTIITRSSKPGNIAAIVRYAEGQKSAARSLETSGELPAKAASDSQLLEPAVHNGVSTSDPIETGLPPLHTRFLPDPHPIRDRYFWLLHGLAPHGTIYIDTGAYAALTNKAGLLPVGVVNVEGNFGQQECVRVSVLPSRSALHSEAEEVGRALVNYSAIEIKRIRGVRSSQIAELLGYADSEYIALRDSVALFKKEVSRPVTPMQNDKSSMGRLNLLEMVVSRQVSGNQQIIHNLRARRQFASAESILPDTPTSEDEQYQLLEERKTQPWAQQTISFTELSPELRNRIYEYAFPHRDIETALVIDTPFLDETMTLATQPAITRISKQVRAESLAMFYARTTFVAYLRENDFRKLCQWVRCVTLASIAPRVTVHVKLLDWVQCEYQLLQLMMMWRGLRHETVHLKIHNCFIIGPNGRDFDQRQLVVETVEMAERLKVQKISSELRLRDECSSLVLRVARYLPGCDLISAYGACDAHGYSAR